MTRYLGFNVLDLFSFYKQLRHLKSALETTDLNALSESKRSDGETVDRSAPPAQSTGPQPHKPVD